jgi:aerobic-type carbon monoxide dehydrogenase small subunit (CoxS/CutS family)
MFLKPRGDKTMLKIQGKSTIRLNVNEEIREVTVKPSDILLTVLREQLGLTGTKPGCENGDCGACTVLVDGWPVKACLMLAVEAIGHRILTVEGLKNAPVQSAFVEKWGFQCGYCTSGFLMVCHALSQIHPNAQEYVMEEWLQSNICRCTSYEEIREAARAILSKKT